MSKWMTQIVAPGVRAAAGVVSFGTIEIPSQKIAVIFKADPGLREIPSQKIAVIFKAI